MKNFKKGSVSIFLIIIIIIVLMIGGYLYLERSSNTADIATQPTQTNTPETDTQTYSGKFYGFSYPTTWTVWEANSLVGLTIIFPTNKSNEVMNKTISSTDEIQIGLLEGPIDLNGLQKITLNGQVWYVKNYNTKMDGGTENGISYYKAYSDYKYIELTSGISNKGVLEEVASTFVIGQ